MSFCCPKSARYIRSFGNKQNVAFGPRFACHKKPDYGFAHQLAWWLGQRHTWVRPCPILIQKNTNTNHTSSCATMVHNNLAIFKQRQRFTAQKMHVKMRHFLSAKPSRICNPTIPIVLNRQVLGQTMHNRKKVFFFLCRCVAQKVPDGHIRSFGNKQNVAFGLGFDIMKSQAMTGFTHQLAWYFFLNNTGKNICTVIHH